MIITATIYWISLSLLVFCYAGYGIIIFLFNTITRSFTASKQHPDNEEYLPVAIIITAFNEGEVLSEKVNNTLAIDYPKDKLNIIFVTDGSTDGSESIINDYPGLLLLHQPKRQGKLAAIKRGMQHVKEPIVVFSDANTTLNAACVKYIVGHYKNPRTGGVACEKKIYNDRRTSGVGEVEGIYWKYESFMKKQDADLNTVVGAAGELFSIRTKLFPDLPDNIILDDFMISMKICLQGYKIDYEPRAFALELPSLSLAEEEKRKVRISAGAYQSIGYLKTALNIFRFPLLAFQYISRRLLRWILCPPLLVILLVSNILLVTGNNPNGFYQFSLYAQLIFYFLGFIGFLIIRSGKKGGVLSIPFYFVFMNYCLLKGLMKFLKGQQTVLWEKSMRQAME